jgi:hypothetical protein
LIGVNTQIVSPSGAYAGIGFAVPVDMVNRIIPELIKHGKLIRPGLGVSLVPDALAARWGIKGLIIGKVSRGGASRCGGAEKRAADFKRAHRAWRHHCGGGRKTGRDDGQFDGCDGSPQGSAIRSRSTLSAPISRSALR